MSEELINRLEQELLAAKQKLSSYSPAEDQAKTSAAHQESLVASAMRKPTNLINSDEMRALEKAVNLAAQEWQAGR